MEIRQMEMHHIGIATDHIENMQQYLNKVASVAQVGETVYDPKQQASLCMITLSDGTQIELIEGPIVSKLVKKRNFLYHICYEVENLDHKIATFLENGAFVISEPKEAVLFNNRKVAFLMTDMGIIELLEK